MDKRDHDRTVYAIALICFLVLANIAVVYFGVQKEKKDRAKVDAEIKVANIANAQAKVEAEARVAAAEAKVAEAAQALRVVGQGHTIRYSPMGDSLTAGYFATTEQNDFVNKLSTLLRDNMGLGVTALEAGNYGGLLSDALKVVANVNRQSPNLITIEFGSSDCSPQQHVDPKIFETELNNLIDGLTVKVGRDPIIVLVTTWDQGVMGDPFDQAIIKVGGERHIPVANVHPIWTMTETKGPPNRMTFNGPSDAFHPNDYGHGSIAEAIYQQVKPILLDRIKQGTLSEGKV